MGLSAIAPTSNSKWIEYINKEGEKMRNQLYKKYYPVSDYLQLYGMSTQEVTLLISCIKRVILEMESHNSEEIRIARIHDSLKVRLWKVNYGKPISYLCEKLRNTQFVDLDRKDLSLINEVLYRYKYGNFLSYLVTPKRTQVWSVL